MSDTQDTDKIVDITDDKEKMEPTTLDDTADIIETKPAEDVGGLDDDGDDDIMITLITGDDDDKPEFKISKKAVTISGLINTLMGESDDISFTIPGVTKIGLEKSIEFMNMHVKFPAKEVEKPLKSNKVEEVFQKEYQEFMNISEENQADLFEMITTANYLEIKPMLDMCCARVATMITGKPAEQIRETFGIVNDYTPEEEAEIAKENEWALKAS
jgi:S-phase kinase-associated protein 1